MTTDDIERLLQENLQDACRLLGCNVAVLYRLDRTQGFTPVLWTENSQNSVPPRLSSASDVSAFVRARGRAPFSLRADTFRDNAMRRGFAAFGISELLVCPLDAKGPAEYVLTFGSNSPFSEAMGESARQAIARTDALLDELGAAVDREAQTIFLGEPLAEEAGAYSTANIRLLRSVLTSESFDQLIDAISRHLPAVGDVVIEDGNTHVLASLHGSAAIQGRFSPLSHLAHLDLTDRGRTSLSIPAALLPFGCEEGAGSGTGPCCLVVPLYGGDEFLGLLSLHDIELPLINANRTFIATAAFAATYLIRSQQATRSHTLQQALTSVENERRRMSIDLHDETSQNLVALTVHLSTAERALEKQRFEDAAHLMEDCRCIADGILTEVNRLSSELRSSELTYLGLQSAIEGEANQRLPRAGIAYRLSGNALDRRFNALQETMLLKGVVEALSNCVRHAQATEVSIALDDDGTWFSIEVADNGVGFDDVSVRPAGASATYGLKTMYDCAEALGGTFWIGSSPGEGTTVRFSIPNRLLEEDVSG